MSINTLIVDKLNVSPLYVQVTCEKIMFIIKKEMESRKRFDNHESIQNNMAGVIVHSNYHNSDKFNHIVFYLPIDNEMSIDS